MPHWWQDYPWRMVQTNLREIDMEDIRAADYVAQLQAFHANVALINTGGIIASYPTKVEDHFQSTHLHGDSLQEVMTACRNAGIRVIARMDFSKVRLPIYQRHPDWAYRTAAGDIVNYNGDVHVCLCGGYQQEKAFEIIREVVETLPLDGLFINMGGFQVRDYSYNEYGICHCDSCKRRFRERFGMALPEREDMNDPAYRAYRVFQREVTEAYRTRLAQVIHGMNPEIVIDNIDFTRMESNTEYKRPLPFWPYSAASNTRALRGVDGRMVSSNTSVDFIGFFYRHVAVNPEEQELRLWQDVANFGGVDYYLIGRLDNHEDQSGFEAVKRVFGYAEAHAEEYRGLDSVAEVLVLRGDRWANVPEERGWIRVLTEAHMLFDEALLASLRPEDDLSRYRAVVLPDAASLPNWLVQKLDDFAEEGGTVIASGQTALMDNDYHPLADYPLRCMGVHRIRENRADMVSAMLHVSAEDLTLFPSYDKDRLLYFGDRFLFAAFDGEPRAYMKLIPPHPFGPPERCYYTEISDVPGVTINDYGRGRGIFIPWQPGTLYARDGYGNTFRFLRDLLLHGAGIPSAEDAPFTPMVAVTAALAKDKSRLLIQLVNNSGHFGTSYFAPVPIDDVSLRISCPHPPHRVVSQTDGRDVPFSWHRGYLHVKASVSGYFEGLAASL